MQVYTGLPPFYRPSEALAATSLADTLPFKMSLVVERIVDQFSKVV